MALPVFTQWMFAVRTNSGLLRNWKRHNNHIVFSCPICGDSAKDRTKARGNIHEYKGELVYSCYNCGTSMSFTRFLKEFNEPLYKEMKLEGLRASGKAPYPEKEKQESKKKVPISEIDWMSVFQKPRGEPLKYLESRKIPLDKGILYTPNFKRSIVDLYELFDLDLDEMSPCKEEPRIIFPFIHNGILTYVQGRSIDPAVPKEYRYMTQEINGGHKIYGLEFAKPGKKYVTEGPIDSYFTPNGVAAADANLTRAAQVIPKEELVLVFDNEPRSKINVKKMEQALESGFEVVIWPEYVLSKDPNEMLLTEKRNPVKLIEENIYKGPGGLLRLANWKRVDTK